MSEPIASIQIQYDDQLEDVVDKVNRALEPVGLTFRIVEAVNDGFEDYELVRIAPARVR